MLDVLIAVIFLPPMLDIPRKVGHRKSQPIPVVKRKNRGQDSKSASRQIFFRKYDMKGLRPIN
ncbi:MAG: hypothetical protein A2V87_12065 [Deltaproteobacteria bacterium RBG_16_58_17]|nr:MAG: hypothetical protein A2V87_12065 [Deltaproteobacteria bacterium RBG_16_58_17]